MTLQVRLHSFIEAVEKLNSLLATTVLARILHVTGPTCMRWVTVGREKARETC